jgi:hypothetical protein
MMKTLIPLLVADLKANRNAETLLILSKLQ